MARPTKHDWPSIKKHYEAGMKQPELIAKFKCPKSTLSQKVKDEKWVVIELAKNVVEGIIEVNEQINELNELDSELTEIATTIGIDKSKKTLLIEEASQLLLGNIVKGIKKGKSQIVVKVKDYDGEGRVIGETPMPVDVEHTAKDHKDLADAIDKTAITLGVAARHANSQVTVNTQNNLNQTSEIKTIDDIYE